jgi:hypothetical protein
MSRCKPLLASIAINAALLLALVGYLASMAVPASEATRLRNALLLDVGTERDFDWTPSAPPPGYKVEHGLPTAQYRDIVLELGIESLAADWPKALKLAGHLTQNAHDRGPIQADMDDAYRGIVNDGRGYCADFTQVYLGLAHAAGLFAREWGFSFDGYSGNGHAFIEVFDRQRNRWVWLDVYNNVHAIDRATGVPLSAAELHRALAGGMEGVSIEPNGPGRLGYRHTSKLIEYYRRGAAEWYLWWGNAVFSYETSKLVHAGQKLGAPVAQLTAIALGEHPRIKALPGPQNTKQLERMAALRNQLIAIAVAGLLLATALLVQLLMLLKRWRQAGVRMAPRAVAG